MAKTVEPPGMPAEAHGRGDQVVARAAPPDHARFPCFDGLRAIAAVGILVHHVAFWSRGGLSPTFGPYFAELNVGVYVFFVISGFLLYRPFAAGHLGGRTAPKLADFWWRRAFRIYPAYWVALTVTIFVLPLAFIGFSGVREGVLNFLLLQRYTTSANIFAGLPQAWTLVVEVSFYVFVPLYALVVARLASRLGVVGELLGIGVLIVLGLVTQVASIYDGPIFQPLNVLPYFFSVFALGMLLAVVSAWLARQPAIPRWVGAVGRVPWLWWLLSAACFVFTVEVLGIPASGGYGLDDAFSKVWLHSLVGFFLVIPAVFGPADRGLVRGFLRWAPIAYLGVISYGIYLWQLTGAALVRDEWWGKQYTQVAFWQLLLPVFVLTVALASVSWFVVERPLIMFSRKPIWHRSV